MLSVQSRNMLRKQFITKKIEYSFHSYSKTLILTTNQASVRKIYLQPVNSISYHRNITKPQNHAISLSLGRKHTMVKKENNLIQTNPSFSSSFSSLLPLPLHQQQQCCTINQRRHISNFSKLQKVERANAKFDFDTVNEMIQFSIKTYANNNAFGTYITDPNHPKGKHYEWITYAEFGDMITKFKRVLMKFNIEKDSKVAIISNNRLEWAVALFATNSIGAQYVPMYEAQLEKDWKYIIEDAGVKLVIVATEKIYDQVKGYIGNVGQVQGVLCLETSDDYMHSYKRWMKLAEKEPDPPAINITENDHSVLIYTSGTTGKPKGVILSHRNIVSNLKGIKEVWKDYLYRYTCISFLPWAHVFGQVAELQSMLAMGSSMAIVNNRDSLMESIPLVKPSLLFSVPMLFNKVYDGVQKKMASSSPITKRIFKWALKVSRSRNKNLELQKPVPILTELQFKIADALVFKKIRDLLGGNIVFLPSGGAGVPKNVVEFFEDIGIPICEGYGLTETSPVISTGVPDFVNRRIGCVGVILPNLDVRIVDPETLASRPHDEEGEIIVAGPSVMVGYHNNPKANEEVFANFDGKRFFRTGDLGILVQGKFLKITGRLKEQYKLENGKYVVPAPLEDDLCRSHFIAQALVFGSNKPFNIVLIVLDVPEIKTWMSKQGIPVPEDMKNLANHDRVAELLAQEINQVCSVMKSYERPARFAILDEPFTQENQLLTPKLSLRRKIIIEKYKTLIDEIYNKSQGYTVPRTRDTESL